MWHSLDKKEVITRFKTSENGLSDEEAEKRLKDYGKNEIKQVSKLGPIFIFLEQFKSVFIIILFAAALFSFFIQHYVDFAVIIIIVLINSIVGFLQQYKAEKIISEMKELLVPKVKVLRNGEISEISSLELVPGDIMIISEGDKITADCRLIHVNELQTNEAVLTGESFPQDKSSEKIGMDTPLADRENMIYAGTTIARGNAKALVVSTGMETEFGRIAGLVQKIKSKRTPLEEKLDKFSKRIAVVVLVLATLITIMGVMEGEALFDMVLAGISLAVAVIPEGLPAVISITLAFAIKRMQKYNALIRKLPAGETLGRTTVICTDKTGTLTEEEISVNKIYCNNQYFNVEENSFFSDKKKISPEKNKELMQLLRTGIMCNNARLEIEDKKLNVIGDPTEKALVLSAYKAGFIKKIELEKEIRIREYSFSSSRKMMSIVRKDGKLTSYTKGAPDVLMKHCSRELVSGQVINMTEKRKNELLRVYEGMASDALRVLAFAFREVPEKFNQDIAEDNLIFLGFQGMLDMPRKEVREAIHNCKEAGIKIKMITGDSEITAVAIGQMIDLDGSSIDGSRLEKLSKEEFDKVVREKTIFARITPELKLRIVQSLKEQKEIVAVTGDGVNDILALKEAHIGIAMGVRGTDVTREVADIILLDDNFKTIVNAVREGRRVYDNMKKSIKFHLSANLGELLVVLIALSIALPLPLLPLAILWMNLVTDSLPSLALSVEKEEEDIMKRKPINHNGNILHGIFRFIIATGILSAGIALVLFLSFQQIDLDKARTITLTYLIFNEFFIAFACRSDHKTIFKLGLLSNKFLLGSILISAALQLIAIYTPLASVFGLKALSLGEIALAIGASSLIFILFEAIKLFKKKK